MIAELNLNEVLYVSGGATCPDGTRLESVVIEEGPNGTTTTTTCVATSSTETIAEGASIFSDIAEGASNLWEAGKDLLGL